MGLGSGVGPRARLAELDVEEAEAVGDEFVAGLVFACAAEPVESLG